MVRLVWFPGYVDWERRKYTWEIREQTRTFAERGRLHKVPVRYRPNAASGGWSYGRGLVHCREKGTHPL